METTATLHGAVVCGCRAILIFFRFLQNGFDIVGLLCDKNDMSNTQTTKGNAMNVELIQAIQGKLIDIATENGIDLADEFKTRKAWKDFVLSFTVKAVMDVMHWDVRNAYDAVLGDGKFQELADGVWETVNAN